MALQWQAPPQFKGSELLDQNSVEGIMNAYFRAKQQSMQGQEMQFNQNRQTNQDANAEKDRVSSDLERQGYDSRLATPEARRMAALPAPQGPAMPGQQTPAQQENPLFGLIRQHIEKKKAGEDRGARLQESEITKNLREPAAMTKPTAKTYKADDGKNRIGMWTHNGLVTSPDDPLASESTMSMPDKSDQAMMAKAKSAAANARASLGTIAPELERIRSLNKKSRAGLIGEAQQRISSSLNIGQEDPEYKNTVETINSLQAMVAKVLKSTFGGQLSDGERNYLREVYGASARYTQKERETAIDTILRMTKDSSTQADAALAELSAGSSGSGHDKPKHDHSALLDKYGAP